MEAGETRVVAEDNNVQMMTNIDWKYKRGGHIFLDASTAPLKTSKAHVMIPLQRQLWDVKWIRSAGGVRCRRWCCCFPDNHFNPKWDVCVSENIESVCMA